jgi:ribonuclease HII
MRAMPRPRAALPAQPPPDFHMEAEAGCPVAGVDEAGCGPLAGPVVAAAVILDARDIPDGIDDSKKLTAARREAVFAALTARAQIGVGAASVEEIDSLNILWARMLAMERALAALAARPGLVLIDGNRAPKGVTAPARTVVGGDARCVSIAAASIVAKVTRDRIMCELALAHPVYGWESNKGYNTATHRAGLARHGPCRHHRRTFATVAKLLIPQPVTLL